MNRWIYGLHRVWARARKKEPLFLAAAALLLFFLNEPWVLWGGLLLGALDAYQLDLEKRLDAPSILGRALGMLLTALFVSPHSYPLALPGAVFLDADLYPVGRLSSFLGKQGIGQAGTIYPFSLLFGNSPFS